MEACEGQVENIGNLAFVANLIGIDVLGSDRRIDADRLGRAIVDIADVDEATLEALGKARIDCVIVVRLEAQNRARQRGTR